MTSQSRYSTEVAARTPLTLPCLKASIGRWVINFPSMTGTNSVLTSIERKQSSEEQLQDRSQFGDVEHMTTYFVSQDRQQRTSGIQSLNRYCEGRNVELVIAPLNNCGLVFPSLAMICCRTEPAPVQSVRQRCVGISSKILASRLAPNGNPFFISTK